MISPPISLCSRRAVWIFANRNRFGKNPHGCWPKQMTGAVVMGGNQLAVPAPNVAAGFQPASDGRISAPSPHRIGGRDAASLAHKDVCLHGGAGKVRWS